MVTRRRTAFVGGVLVLMLASSALATGRHELQSSPCAAALVHFEQNRGLGGGATAWLPWIVTGPRTAPLTGYLWSYEGGLADARVNRSPRLVLGAGVRHKILWHPRKSTGNQLHIRALRLDDPGSFSTVSGPATVPGSGVGLVFPSSLTFPQAGCWRLDLRIGSSRRSVTVEVIEPVPARTCDATPLDQSGSIGLMPPRAKLEAGWGWRSPDGGALMYTGGKTPDGGNTKVLWRTSRDVSRISTGDLVLRGTRLDGAGSFVQRLQEVNPRGYWPSTVVIPTAGCWLLTARVEGLPAGAGILVARVVDG